MKYLRYQVPTDLKVFVSRKDATEYIKKHTNTKVSNVADLFKEIKRIENMKLPIKTI